MNCGGGRSLQILALILFPHSLPLFPGRKPPIYSPQIRRNSKSRTLLLPSYTADAITQPIFLPYLCRRPPDLVELSVFFSLFLVRLAMAAGEASSSGGGGEEASGSGSGSGTWTWEQDKAFEDALATLGEPDDEAAVWDWIALAVEGKTGEEVRRHYELLVEDVDDIEAGRVPLLDYAHDRRGGGGEKAPSSAQQERRKGGTWTLEEHE
jgi:hypothetical protein